MPVFLSASGEEIAFRRLGAGDSGAAGHLQIFKRTLGVQASGPQQAAGEDEPSDGESLAHGDPGSGSVGKRAGRGKPGSEGARGAVYGGRRVMS